MRCGEFDRVDSFCLKGGKDVHEPEKLRYCIGYTGRIPAPSAIEEVEA